MNPKILSCAIALPEFSRTTAEILPFVDTWLQEEPQRFRDKVKRIFKYAKVDKRYSIMDIEQAFMPSTFEEKNDYYIEKTTDLAEQALVKGLAKANLAPDEIDIIITVSCTGIMIPSVDAFLINRLKMRQDIMRLPVTEMGCAAGISALIYANNFLKAMPNKRVAIIAVESPISTFQHNDKSMANMVSAAIFGDGAACVILGPSKELRPCIIDSEMYHFHDEINMMGFQLKNSGLKMILDPAVPSKIEEHFDEILLPFIKQNGLSIAEVEHLIFHPGGKKIVQIVEQLFGEMGKNIDETKAVLAEYGNMSSVTVLYVLDRYLEKDIAAGEHGLMLSFGPGFSAQRVLLKWEEG